MSAEALIQNQRPVRENVGNGIREEGKVLMNIRTRFVIIIAYVTLKDSLDGVRDQRSHERLASISNID